MASYVAVDAHDPFGRFAAIFPGNEHFARTESPCFRRAVVVVVAAVVDRETDTHFASFGQLVVA